MFLFLFFTQTKNNVTNNSFNGAQVGIRRYASRDDLPVQIFFFLQDAKSQTSSQPYAVLRRPCYFILTERDMQYVVELIHIRQQNYWRHGIPTD